MKRVISFLSKIRYTCLNFLKRFQTKHVQSKQILAVGLMGFLLLTTNAQPGLSNLGTPAAAKRVLDQAHRTDSERPKTMREWEQEARQTDADPAERLERIGKESAAAVKEFGQNYAEGTRKTAEDIQEGASRMAS